MKRSFGLLVCGCWILGSVAAGSEVPGQQEEHRQKLVRQIDSILQVPVDSGAVAGISAGVVYKGDTLLLKAYGFADLEHNVPTPSDAVYEIGSVTKQFTATAILQLVDQERIDLDADLTAYLPEYPTGGRAIPIRRLMDHTSGIKGYTEMQEFATIATRSLPRDSLVAMFSAAPFDFEPFYNNSAYFLLGLMIEEASGKPYEEFIDEHLFTPAGMEDSRYCSQTEIVTGRAHGYAGRPEGLVRGGYIDHTWPYAAGSLCSTVRDLLRWNAALHGDSSGGHLLSAESYLELITPGHLNDGTPVRYAMGLGIADFGGRRMIAHGGGIPGFLSDMRYFPNEDLTIVVLINTTGRVSPAAMARTIAGFVLGEPDVPAAGIYPGNLDGLVGTYVGPGRGTPLTVTIDRHESTLTASFGNGDASELHYIDGLRFGLGDTRFTFLRRGGTISILQVDQVSGLYVLDRQD